MIIEIFKIGIESSMRTLLDTLPFVLPVSLVLMAWSLWRYYIVRDYISKIEWITLEIKLPKDHMKTPAAMEVVLGAFFNFPTPPSWWDYWWVGKSPVWYSLELVSIEGHVHFIVRTPKSNKGNVENHVYSQYPNAEVHEVPDYVGGVNYDVDKPEWSMFGTEQILVREDAYPIKTYIDYGLDRELLKEEQKVDPITPTIELLGSIGKGEQIWFQIMVMAAQKRFPKAGTWFGKEDWQGNAKAVLAKLLKRDTPAGATIRLSPGETETAKAVERSLTKIGFDCGIRVLHLKRNDMPNKSSVGAGMIMSILRQYGSTNLNSFKPTRFTSMDWWVDPLGTRLPRMKREMFTAYVNRGYFYHPFRYTAPFTLNSEELATMYHFPGAVAVTPTFGRIESKRAEAPVNLPI